MRNTLVLIMGAAGHAQHALRVRERRRTGTRRGSSVGNPRAPSPRHPSAPALPVARVAHGPRPPRRPVRTRDNRDRMRGRWPQDAAIQQRPGASSRRVAARATGSADR